MGSEKEVKVEIGKVLVEIGRKNIFEPEFNDEGMIMPPTNLMNIVDLQKLGSDKI